ncbi:hypothetical protein A3C28_03370 [Candidatus Roizmanbacteria bacterium RIFCSPHIGHO2_02_FULL_39_9]|uniref:Activator of Hsp90 ATPase homologue 1/2-like C-terminal domain-containing protein n=2 Tax=Candidatus Roizmaniibacteriota TaxID=1752723 RepID=A0A1F7I2U9_9BACT|nr:MAG: hypothetical protein A3C28_03370 [Candidatus Roizmanbacteria bacterium RIFCSPHIGHO2_02_FULL_39_9]OGK37694.1 MAG: hypothetical protein A3F60_01990 [Candidatus Roizmanbacteria bacterium RIFCSPHIGHO2_12_FULL_39_8]
MKTIKQKYAIHAPLIKVWEAFVDPAVIDLWGGGPAKMNAKTGTEFSLWNGDIHGKNTEVIPHKKLVQDWYGGDWPQASRVTFIFSEKNESTNVSLLHEDVPDKEFKGISDGWKDYYLGPLKKLLEKK